MAVEKKSKETIQKTGENKCENCIFDQLIEQQHGRKDKRGKLSSDNFKPRPKNTDRFFRT